MIFQVGGAGFQTAFQELQKWGFAEAILPFLLFFALLFAVLQKVHLFGEKGAEGWAPNRKLNGVAAFVIAMMLVVPHIMSPSANDPVSIVNKILPASAIIVFALVVILLLIGMTSFNKEGEQMKSPLVQLAGLGGVAVLAYIILATVFPTQLGIGLGPLTDPKIQALVIVIAIFAIIVWFVTKEEKPKGERRWWTTPQELMGKP
ncbi:hypothetical protein KY329_00960 [Candidatus Woesearchaeota archaeon]|nr:hypothetical protein [Candidatus Woesearchaeota archaeon]